jgi:hypothetical protein
MLWPSSRSLQLVRPGVDQGFELLRQRVAVGRDVQPRVAVQVDGIEAAGRGQQTAMVLAFAKPLAVVHAQAVQQHQQLRAGAWQRRGDGVGLQHQRHAAHAQRHRRGQGAARGSQVVAQHAVERGEHGLALGAGRRAGAAALQHRLQQREQSVDAAAHHPRDTSHAAVDQAGDAGRAA